MTKKRRQNATKIIVNAGQQKNTKLQLFELIKPFRKLINAVAILWFIVIPAITFLIIVAALIIGYLEGNWELSVNIIKILAAISK